MYKSTAKLHGRRPFGQIRLASVSLFLSFSIVILLLFHLGQVAFIDASGASLSRAQLLLFPMIWLIAALVVLLESNRISVYYFSFFALLTFIFYVSTIFVIKNNIDLVSFLLSRHGMLVWLLTGCSFGVAVSCIHYWTIDALFPFKTIMFVISLFVMIVSLNFYGYHIYSKAVTSLGLISDDAYQSAGAAGSILLWVSQGLTLLLAGKYPRFKLWIVITFILSSVLFSISLFLAGSALIIAFLFLILSVMLCCSVDKRPLYSVLKVLFAICVITLFVSWNLDFLANFFKGTRFEAIGDGVLAITSVSSRLSGFAHFFAQFSVDPILGNYDSHILAGSGDGWYMHSVLLSLFSHAGVIGFLFFVTPFLLILQRLLARYRKQYNLVYNNFFSLIGVFILGSLTAFFTWTPLWFILGACLISYKKEGSHEIVNAGDVAA